MLFNSLPFLIFAALFFALWPLVRTRNTSRWCYLVTASFFFYGWWDWRYLGLIVVSGLIDFLVALAIGRRETGGRGWLIVSLIGNLGILFIFKYHGFFVDVVNDFAVLAGNATQLSSLNLVLPVGISFFTFQSMSYTIDVYRRRLVPTTNFLHFMSYLALFPQLVAGPIVRARDLLPALESWRVPTAFERWGNFRMITIGFFKKMVVADNLAPLVDHAFHGGVNPEGAWMYWWVIAVMFSAQIYCDFSGYTDIARGLGGMMGYDFPENFNHPYVAVGFRDFWSRWHISLSTWFRDYVYIPLGGSKTSRMQGHINMWITILLSGVWHGSGWNFIFWGALHATYLSIERIVAWPKLLMGSMVTRLLGIAITFTLTTIAWIPFRAESLQQTVVVFRTMFTPTVNGLTDLRNQLGLEDLTPLGLLLILEVSQLVSARIRRGMIPTFEPIMVAILIVLTVLFRGPGKQFVYFQF